MNTYQLLFPSPIAIIDASENFKKDHDFLLNSEYVADSGGVGQFLVTKDKHILGEQIKDLTAWLQEQVNLFAHDFLATNKTLKFTQSWCIKHDGIPQQLYAHSHPNSIISGAYYVSADENSARLRFHKTASANVPFIQHGFDDELLKDQPWAWEWQEIPVQTSRLVLFPSHMQHSSANFDNKDLRCVLSFNTWFEGTIGNPNKLTELGGIV
jgi:hypothetical protein